MLGLHKKFQFIKISRNLFKNFTTGLVRRKEISMSANDLAKRMVWMDLEMTGLNIDEDKILEMACLVTDDQLNVVATGPNIIVHQSNDILKTMNSWCLAHHGESGLTKASQESNISIEKAEEMLLAFVKQHVLENRSPLAGNSVYMDRLFLRKFMPTLNSYLHYRIIDVSSVKELVKRWYPREYSRIPVKKFKHRATDDILDSIDELKYYRQFVFKTPICE